MGISHKTHESILGDLIDSFQVLLDDIDANQKALKLTGRTSDQAKLARTRKRIRTWFLYNSNRY